VGCLEGGLGGVDLLSFSGEARWMNARSSSCRLANLGDGEVVLVICV
jgi:hypothetical protein